MPRIRARLPISASRLTSAFAAGTDADDRDAARRWRARRGRRAGSGAPTSSRIDVEGPVVGEDSRLDHLVGTEAGDRGPQPLVPHGGDDVASRRARASCTAAMPTPPAAPWTQQPLAHLQAALGEQRVVRGREDLGKATRLVPRDTRRAPGSGGAGGRSPARPAHRPPATAITRSPSAKRLGPGPRPTTSPASLQPGDVSRGPWRCGVEPGHLQEVGVVDPCGPHLDEHLTEAGDRVGVLPPLQAAVDDGDRVHGGRRRQPRWLIAT